MTEQTTDKPEIPDEPGPWFPVRNRAEVRRLGRHATAGRGRARRAAAVRHPLASTR